MKRARMTEMLNARTWTQAALRPNNHATMKTLFTALALLAAGATIHAATAINPVNAFASGANIRWVNWRGDVSNGAAPGRFPMTNPH